MPVEAGQVGAMATGLAGGVALGLGFERMVGIGAALTPQDFYQSMTTHSDQRI